MRVVIRQSGDSLPQPDGGEVLMLRTYAAQVPGPLVLYCTEPDDEFELRLAADIENSERARYLNSTFDQRTVEYIRLRGAELGRVVLISAEAGLSGPNDVTAIDVVGDASVFRQAWECLIPPGADAPLSIHAPVRRVLSETTSYPVSAQQAQVLRVLLVTARTQPFFDIAPRQVSKPLRDLMEGFAALQVCVICPGTPNAIEEILPDATRHDDVFQVLHLDCHGVLMSHAQLHERYGPQRRVFEDLSWGQTIEPYDGERGFVLIDWTEGGLPVSGAEFGRLCRRARIRAVVLNACEAGSSAVSGSFAMDLLREGVPDVVAVRHKLKDAVAQKMVRALYADLATNGSLEQAVGAARRAIIVNAPSRPEGESDDGDGDGDGNHWLTLAHFSTEHGQASQAQKPSFAGQPSAEPQAAIGWLPEPLEWKLHQLQGMVARERRSHLASGDDPGHPAAPLVLSGAIGLGAEAVALALAQWLADTDVDTSGAAIIDLSEGFAAAMGPLRGGTTEQVRARVVDQAGRDSVLVLQDIDFASDSGTLSSEEFEELGKLITELGASAVTCLLPMTQMLSHGPEVPGHRAMAASLFALPLPSCVEHVLRPEQGVLDAEHRAFATLCTWLCAGYGDFVLALDPLPCADDLRQLLDFFVFGEPPPAFVKERLSATYVRSEARYARLVRDSSCASLDPCLAAMGAGMVLSDIAQIGRPLGERSFPSSPVVDDAAAMRALLRLYENGLATTPAPDTLPDDWFIEPGLPTGFLCIPFLRPMARRRLSAAELAGLDEWAVEFSIDKIHYFSQHCSTPAKTKHHQPFIEHALPLFAVAMWLAMESNDQIVRFTEAVDEAVLAGWWPAAVEPRLIFGPATGASSSAYTPDSLGPLALVFDAMELSRIGDFPGARAALAVALEAATEQHNGAIRTVALLKLATVEADQNNLDECARLLRDAELSRLRHGPLRLEPELAYESASLMRKRGRREDAVLRFRQAVDSARRFGSHHIECLCFQELAALELELVWVDPAGLELEPEARRVLQDRATQATDYLDRAQAIATRAGFADGEAAQHCQLRARIALLRGDTQAAMALARQACEGFSAANDWRAEVSVSLMNLIRAVQAKQ